MKAQPYNNTLGGGGITGRAPAAPRNYDCGFYTYKIGRIPPIFRHFLLQVPVISSLVGMIGTFQRLEERNTVFRPPVWCLPCQNLAILQAIQAPERCPFHVQFEFLS